MNYTPEPNVTEKIISSPIYLKQKKTKNDYAEIKQNESSSR